MTIKWGPLRLFITSAIESCLVSTSQFCCVMSIVTSNQNRQEIHMGDVELLMFERCNN